MVAKQERKEKIYEMMRQGDWRAVCKEFHVRQFTKLLDLKYLQPCQDPQRPKPIFQKEDEYREPLLVWVRPSQVWHTHRHNFLQTTSTNDTISINDIFQKGCNFLVNNQSLGMSSVDSPEAHRAWYQPCLQVRKKTSKCFSKG